MESRINKLANITGNGPQRPSETTWLLPMMMLRNWKSVFFSFSFLESNKKVMQGFYNRCGGAQETILFFCLALSDSVFLTQYPNSTTIFK